MQIVRSLRTTQHARTNTRGVDKGLELRDHYSNTDPDMAPTRSLTRNQRVCLKFVKPTISWVGGGLCAVVPTILCATHQSQQQTHAYLQHMTMSLSPSPLKPTSGHSSLQ